MAKRYTVHDSAILAWVRKQITLWRIRRALRQLRVVSARLEARIREAEAHQKENA